MEASCFFVHNSSRFCESHELAAGLSERSFKVLSYFPPKKLGGLQHEWKEARSQIIHIAQVYEENTYGTDI